MKRLSSKARAELVLVVWVLLAGLGLLQPGLLLVAVVVVVHLAVGLYFAQPGTTPRLQAQRRLSAGTVPDGDQLEIEVDVENLGSALDLVALDDGPPTGLTLADGESAAVVSLSPGERTGLRYTVRARRGRHQMEAVCAEVRDLLGCTVWQGEIACPVGVVALPRHEPLRSIAIAPRRMLVVPGTARARRGGAGIEWFGTREYRPGDPVRRIHWRALARWGTPAVIQFEEERAANVVVILDVRARAYPPDTGAEILDAGAGAAAALCDAFLQQGHRVALMLYGVYRHWVYPGYGRRHALRLHHELARAQLGTSAWFAELGRLPTQLLGSGSQLVLVSPLAPGDEDDLGRLAARGYPVMVLIPEVQAPESRTTEDLPDLALAERIVQLERRAILRRLRLAGVRLLVWDIGRPLAPLVRAGWRRLSWY